MISQLLREGFAEARRRPGLILMDILWKTIWAALTICGLVLIGYWLASRIPWQLSNIDPLGGWLGFRILREVWIAYGGQLLSFFSALLFFSAVTWILLEAVFRKRLVSA